MTWNPPVKRFVAISLTVFFLFTQALFSHMPEKSVWDERRKVVRLAALPQLNAGLTGFGTTLPVRKDSLAAAPKTPLVSQLLPLLSVNGTVREIHPALSAFSQAPVVVYIQDIHGQKRAQENIAALVLKILEMNPHAAIGLEGTAGPVPAQRFRRQSADLNKEIGSFYLNVGWITGAEYAVFAAKETPRTIGIEEKSLYLENVRAVQTALSQKERVLKHVQTKEKALNDEKASVYSNELKELEQKTAAHDAGALGLTGYLSYLMERSQANKNTVAFPQIDLFLDTVRLENALDIKASQTERNAVLKQIVLKLGSERLHDLMNQTAALRSHVVSYPDFYRTLEELIKEANISLDPYPNFKAYIRYVKQADAIKPAPLLKEARVLKRTIGIGLCATQEQRDLYQATEKLELVEKLVRFRLTAEEWEEYKREVRSQKPEARINKKSLFLLTSDSWLLTPFERFYEKAQARNRVMAENLLKAMENEDLRMQNKNKSDLNLHSAFQNPHLSILVAGGFHSGGVVEWLRRKATVVVVTPKLDHMDPAQTSEYLSVFTREKTPLEKLFLSPKLTLPETLSIQPLYSKPIANAVHELTDPLAELFHKAAQNGSASRSFNQIKLTAKPLTNGKDKSDRSLLLEGRSHRYRVSLHKTTNILWAWNRESFKYQYLPLLSLSSFLFLLRWAEAAELHVQFLISISVVLYVLGWSGFKFARSHDNPALYDSVYRFVAGVFFGALTAFPVLYDAGIISAFVQLYVPILSRFVVEVGVLAAPALHLINQPLADFKVPGFRMLTERRALRSPEEPFYYPNPVPLHNLNALEGVISFLNDLIPIDLPMPLSEFQEKTVVQEIYLHNRRILSGVFPPKFFLEPSKNNRGALQNMLHESANEFLDAIGISAIPSDILITAVFFEPKTRTVRFFLEIKPEILNQYLLNAADTMALIFGSPLWRALYSHGTFQFSVDHMATALTVKDGKSEYQIVRFRQKPKNGLIPLPKGALLIGENRSFVTVQETQPEYRLYHAELITHALNLGIGFAKPNGRRPRGAAILGYEWYLPYAPRAEFWLFRIIVPLLTAWFISYTELALFMKAALVIVSIPVSFWLAHLLRGPRALVRRDVLLMTLLVYINALPLLLWLSSPILAIVVYLLLSIPITEIHKIIDTPGLEEDWWMGSASHFIPELALGPVMRFQDLSETIPMQMADEDSHTIKDVGPKAVPPSHVQFVAGGDRSAPDTEENILPDVKRILKPDRVPSRASYVTGDGRILMWLEGDMVVADHLCIAVKNKEGGFERRPLDNVNLASIQEMRYDAQHGLLEMLLKTYDYISIVAVPEIANGRPHAPEAVNGFLHRNGSLPHAPARSSSGPAIRHSKQPLMIVEDKQGQIVDQDTMVDQAIRERFALDADHPQRPFRVDENVWVDVGNGPERLIDLLDPDPATGYRSHPDGVIFLHPGLIQRIYQLGGIHAPLDMVVHPSQNYPGEAHMDAAFAFWLIRQPREVRVQAAQHERRHFHFPDAPEEAVQASYPIPDFAWLDGNDWDRILNPSGVSPAVRSVAESWGIRVIGTSGPVPLLAEYASRIKQAIRVRDWEGVQTLLRHARNLVPYAPAEHRGERRLEELAGKAEVEYYRVLLGRAQFAREAVRLAARQATPEAWERAQEALSQLESPPHFSILSPRVANPTLEEIRALRRWYEERRAEFSALMAYEPSADVFPPPSKSVVAAIGRLVPSFDVADQVEKVKNKPLVWALQIAPTPEERALLQDLGFPVKNSQSAEPTSMSLVFLRGTPIGLYVKGISDDKVPNPSLKAPESESSVFYVFARFRSEAHRKELASVLNGVVFQIRARERPSEVQRTTFLATYFGDVSVWPDGLGIAPLKGSYYSKSGLTRVMAESIAPRSGSHVLVLGSATGIHAVRAAQRGAAHVTVACSTPRSFVSTFFNVQNSGQASKINVVPINGLEVTPVLASHRYDHVYVDVFEMLQESGENLPDDFYRYPVVGPGNPFSVLLNQLAESLKPSGTLEMIHFVMANVFWNIAAAQFDVVMMEGMKDLREEKKPEEHNFPFDTSRWTLIKSQAKKEPALEPSLQDWELLSVYVRGMAGSAFEVLSADPLFKSSQFQAKLWHKVAVNSFRQRPDDDVGNLRANDAYPELVKDILERKRALGSAYVTPDSFLYLIAKLRRWKHAWAWGVLGFFLEGGGLSGVTLSLYHFTPLGQAWPVVFIGIPLSGAVALIVLVVLAVLSGFHSWLDAKLQRSRGASADHWFMLWSFVIHLTAFTPYLFITDVSHITPIVTAFLAHGIYDAMLFLRDAYAPQIEEDFEWEASLEGPAIRASKKPLDEETEHPVVNWAIEYFVNEDGTPKNGAIIVTEDMRVDIGNGLESLMDLLDPDREYRSYVRPDGGQGARLYVLPGFHREIARLWQDDFKFDTKDAPTDVLFHPGRRRGHVYIDAAVLFWFLRQPLDTRRGAARHEIGHFRLYPHDSEEEVGREAPIQDFENIKGVMNRTYEREASTVEQVADKFNVVFLANMDAEAQSTYKLVQKAKKAVMKRQWWRVEGFLAELRQRAFGRPGLTPERQAIYQKWIDEVMRPLAQEKRVADLEPSLIPEDSPLGLLKSKLGVRRLRVPQSAQQTGFWDYRLDLPVDEKEKLAWYGLRHSGQKGLSQVDVWLIFKDEEPLFLVYEEQGDPNKEDLTVTSIGLLPFPPFERRIWMGDAIDWWINQPNKNRLKMRGATGHLFQAAYPIGDEVVYSTRGVFFIGDVSLRLFLKGLRIRPGDIVWDIGTGCLAIAVAAAHLGARALGSDLVPAAYFNSLVTTVRSSHRGRLTVFKADGLNIPAAYHGLKADKLMANLPVRLKRSAHMAVADPMRKLMNDILRDGPNYLNPKGTAEVTYTFDPVFICRLYEEGWDVSKIEGIDFARKLYVKASGGYSSMDHVRYTLVRPADYGQPAPLNNTPFVEQWRRLALLYETYLEQDQAPQEVDREWIRSLIAQYKPHMNPDNPDRRFAFQLLYKAAYDVELLLEHKATKQRLNAPGIWVNDRWINELYRADVESILHLPTLPDAAPMLISDWGGEQPMSVEIFDYTANSLLYLIAKLRGLKHAWAWGILGFVLEAAVLSGVALVLYYHTPLGLMWPIAVFGIQISGGVALGVLVMLSSLIVLHLWVYAKLHRNRGSPIGTTAFVGRFFLHLLGFLGYIVLATDLSPLISVPIAAGVHGLYDVIVGFLILRFLRTHPSAEPAGTEQPQGLIDITEQLKRDREYAIPNRPRRLSLGRSGFMANCLIVSEPEERTISVPDDYMEEQTAIIEFEPQQTISWFIPIINVMEAQSILYNPEENRVILSFPVRGHRSPLIIRVPIDSDQLRFEAEFPDGTVVPFPGERSIGDTFRSFGLFATSPQPPTEGPAIRLSKRPLDPKTEHLAVNWAIEKFVDPDGTPKNGAFIITEEMKIVIGKRPERLIDLLDPDRVYRNYVRPDGGRGARLYVMPGLNKEILRIWTKVLGRDPEEAPVDVLLHPGRRRGNIYMDGAVPYRLARQKLEVRRGAARHEVGHFELYPNDTEIDVNEIAPVPDFENVDELITAMFGDRKKAIAMTALSHVPAPTHASFSFSVQFSEELRDGRYWFVMTVAGAPFIRPCRFALPMDTGWLSNPPRLYEDSGLDKFDLFNRDESAGSIISDIFAMELSMRKWKFDIEWRLEKNTLRLSSDKLTNLTWNLRDGGVIRFYNSVGNDSSLDRWLSIVMLPLILIPTVYETYPKDRDLSLTEIKKWLKGVPALLARLPLQLQKGDIVIADMTSEHIPGVVALNRRATSAPGSERYDGKKDIQERLYRKDVLGHVALVGPHVVGFLLAQIGKDESEAYVTVLSGGVAPGIESLSVMDMLLDKLRGGAFARVVWQTNSLLYLIAKLRGWKHAWAWGILGLVLEWGGLSALAVWLNTTSIGQIGVMVIWTYQISTAAALVIFFIVSGLSALHSWLDGKTDPNNDALQSFLAHFLGFLPYLLLAMNLPLMNTLVLILTLHGLYDAIGMAMDYWNLPAQRRGAYRALTSNIPHQKQLVEQGFNFERSKELLEKAEAGEADSSADPINQRRTLDYLHETGRRKDMPLKMWKRKAIYRQAA